MDVLRWIKREWDTTQSCKRRESDPSISAYNLQSRKSRDESYMRALAKFNEWRNQDRFGSLRRSSRRKSKKTNNHSASAAEQLSGNDHSTMKSQPNTPQSMLNDDNNHYEEIKTPRNQKTKNILSSAKKILAKRHSCPANNNNNNSRAKENFKVSKSANKCPVICENEVEEFENDHCEIDDSELSTEKVPRQSVSPPTKFYRDNSNPFRSVRTPIRGQSNTSTYSYGTPRRLFDSSTPEVNVSTSLLPATDEIDNHREPKRYDFNPVSIYGSEETTTNRYSKSSPTYQTVVNKHGDLVEYALPFNDQSDEIFGELNHYESKLKATSNLNTTTVPFIVEDETPICRTQSKSLCGLASYAKWQTPRKKVIVTDLDKSDATTKNETVSNDEIFQELRKLEKWSKSRSNSFEDTPLKSSSSQFNRCNNRDNNLIFCTIYDIRQRSSTLHNSMIAPLILFAAGIFRKTIISLRKIDNKRRIQSEQGLLGDLSVLCKIKHPNVALLMAVCLDTNKNIQSLVLEPFHSTLNVLVHNSDNELAIQDCIDYILQVIRAVLYIHENGLIHSNICSHNVLVCDNKKNVKLSSFELTTEIDEKNEIKNEIIRKFYGCNENYKESRFKSSFADGRWNSLILRNEISSKYLPYLIEYRKLFSEYNYQPPELLSTSQHFVFPSKQADVYGVALLLWEMLNTSSPFPGLSYEEMLDVFVDNRQNKLPTLNSSRCELFKSLLENGLNSNPGERIENTQSLKFLVEEAKVNFGLKKTDAQNISNDNSYSCFLRNEVMDFNRNNERRYDLENSPNAMNLQPQIYDKTSTVKRYKKSNAYASRKKIESSCNVQEYLKRQTPPNKFSSRSLDDMLRADEQPNQEKKNYEFQIDDFSLPVTPIARNNKLRKNAWLSNKTLSQQSYTSFNENDEDLKEEPNNKTIQTKQFNISIKIIRNKIDSEEATSPLLQTRPAENAANVSSQIEYWNTVTLPADFNSKKQNNIESNGDSNDSKGVKEAEVRSGNKITVAEITPSPPKIPPKPKERRFLQKTMEERAKYYPNMPELLSETFSRRSYNDDNDFESTLWKRERERCEKSSPRQSEEIYNPNNDSVIRPLRTSVKDTVHKFESFTKKFRPALFSSRESRINFLNNTISLNELTDQTEHILENIVQPIGDSATAVKNYQQRQVNSIEAIPTNTDLPMVVVTETQNDEKSSETFDGTTTEINLSVSKLDIQLKTSELQTTANGNSERKISRLSVPSLNSSAPPSNSKPMLFTVNIRKIRRSASDIGCFRRDIVKPEELLRHTICGTEIRKNFPEIRSNSKNIGNINPDISITSVAESQIQHCKLTCWECGSKVFKIDEVEVNERGIRRGQIFRRFSHSPGPSCGSIRTNDSSSLFGKTQSSEGFYIDDDFNEAVLGPNIQLIGMENFNLFDIVSVDFVPTTPTGNSDS